MNHLPDRELNEMQSDSEDDDSGNFGAWTLVWTLVAMKIITIVVVILAARKAEAGTLFAVMTWHWLVVLGALLVAPVLFRYRLRRVRSRREALMRAEWMVEDDVSVALPRHDVRVRRARVGSEPAKGCTSPAQVDVSGITLP